MKPLEEPIAWCEVAEANARKPLRWGGKRALIAAGRAWVADQPFEDLADLDGQSEAMDIAMCVTGLPQREAEPWADYVYGGMMIELDRRLARKR